MRLDLPTVLLQWATGGLLFLWVTTRRREVGLGYGWLLRSSYGVLALIGLVAGLAAHDHGAGATLRNFGNAGVVLGAGLALVVSVVLRSAGVSGQRARRAVKAQRVATMTPARAERRRCGIGHGPRQDGRGVSAHARPARTGTGPRRDPRLRVRRRRPVRPERAATRHRCAVPGRDQRRDAPGSLVPRATGSRPRAAQGARSARRVDLAVRSRRAPVADRHAPGAQRVDQRRVSRIARLHVGGVPR